MNSAEHAAPPATERPRLDMAQIFRARGEAFRRSHVLTSPQKKAMRAIEACRTEVLGGHVDVCRACGHTAISYNSCRNRHCPKCQGLTQAKWIEERKARILPTNYFHVVFTLPRALRSLARRAPEPIYDLLFASASATLLALGRDPKRLGALLGFTAVLHTWTRKLELHPHLHCVVTGGGLSLDGARWVEAKGNGRFLFPVKVLSALFRGKFLAGLKRLRESGDVEVSSELLEQLYAQDWVVYAKRPFKGAENVYQYLGRYTHRVGISNQRLRAIDEDTVSFATKDGKQVTLSHEEFLERFLLHVLPPRFTKIRHFGLMASSNATTKLETARRLLEANGARSPELTPRPESWQDFYAKLTGVDPRDCPRCKGRTERLELDSPEALAVLARVGKGHDP